MKRVIVSSLLLLLTATIAFAHAGEVHTYLGTITKINKDGSFVMETTTGKSRTVLVSKKTTYTHTDGHKGKHSELSVGKKVSAKISKDGRTALSVKLNAARKVK